MIGSPPNCRPECVINSDCPSDKACISRKCQDPCPGLCGVNAYCRVRNHIPICVCNQGYEGDPFSRCTRITSKFLQNSKGLLKIPFNSNNIPPWNNRSMPPIALWNKCCLHWEKHGSILQVSPWLTGKPLHWMQTWMYHQPRMSSKPGMYCKQMQRPMPWCMWDACHMLSKQPLSKLSLWPWLRRRPIL